MKIKLSIDDGCASDVRVAELSDKYEIETIFYWPAEWHSLAYDNGYEPLTYDEALGIARKYEIGSHTVTHRHLTKLDPLDAEREIMESKFMLQRLFKRDIDKFCPPRGYTNAELTDFTSEFYGSQRLTKGSNLVHIHPNSGANGNIPWRQRFEQLSMQTDDIELWGHSWEWDKYNLWEEVEEFLSEVSHSQL